MRTFGAKNLYFWALTSVPSTAGDCPSVPKFEKKILDLLKNYFGASVNRLSVIFYLFKNALHAKTPVLLRGAFACA